jgi:hypothetical protein
MEKSIKHVNPIIFVVLTAILWGCVQSDHSPTAQKTTPSMGNTKISTEILSPTSTFMNTQTPANTPTQIPIPFPTQGTLNDKDFINLLLETNGGCELPCWWGIIPGETSWDRAEQFLLSFSSGLETEVDEDTTSTDGKTSRRKVLRILLNFEDNNPLGFKLFTKDNLVTGIQVGPRLTDHHFLLKDLLSNQGPPLRVFLHTHANVIEPPTAFSLILYYQKQRFLAIYNTLVTKENEQITACLGDSGPEILIFPEEKDLSDKQIQEIFLGPEPLGVLSSEEALSMTTEEFYLYYRDSISSCITTPADIWP